MLKEASVGFGARHPGSDLPQKGCIISANFLFLLQTLDFALTPFPVVVLCLPRAAFRGDQWFTAGVGRCRKVVFHWQKCLLLTENTVLSEKEQLTGNVKVNKTDLNFADLRRY